MTRHYLVSGRVQGVGFRWFVHREAAELNLKGWVRNLPSGEVECVASGPEEKLGELEAHMRKGSRGSRVDRLQVHDLVDEEGEKLGPFQIEGAW